MNLKFFGNSFLFFVLLTSLTSFNITTNSDLANVVASEIDNCEETDINSNNYLNYNIPLSQLINQPIETERFSILVQKSSYSLFVKYDGRVVKSYPCVFGANPVNDKLKQGDNCTPEGDFYISSIREHFIWGYFMAFDYPNGESWAKHKRAKENGRIESTANIGGDVGIHGVIEGLESYIDTKNNWTEGCVSMKNPDVSELASHLAAGTPIKIVY